MAKSTISAFILSTLLVVLFLFFIDEGYYNFNWMQDGGNWVAFLIYFIGIFLCQIIFYKWIIPIFSKKNKIALSVILGIISGLSLVIYLLSR